MTKNLKIAFAVLIVITAISVVSAIRLNMKVKELQKATTAQSTSAEDVQKIVAEVGKHIVLPATEVPTMAVVSDLSKLQGQPFFERAEVGDIVLIYTTTRRAVLWRPSAQKIIEVSAINLPAPVVQTSPTPVKKPATTATTTR